MLIKSSCHLIIERADSIDVSRCKLLETTSQVSREQVCELLGLIQKKLGFIGICTAFFQNSGEGPDNWEKLVSLLGGHQVGVRERENTWIKKIKIAYFQTTIRLNTFELLNS